MKVFVTVAEKSGDLCSVWVQHDIEAYEAIEELVSTFDGQPANDVSRKPREGEIVLAKYDGQWFRAQVIPGNKCFFIDFGNVEEVSSNNIILAPADYFKTPPLAVKFFLADISASGPQWSVQEFQNLQDTVQNVEFEANVLSSGSAGVAPTIRLLSEGKNISEHLIVSGVGKHYDNNHAKCLSIPSSLLPAGSNHVYVQYSNSAVQFWVQLSSNEQISTELGERLVELVESGLGKIKPADVRIGMPCVAMYDDVPYRAVIKSIQLANGTCRVYFADYGNTEEVETNGLLQLPADMAKTPALVAECSLSGQAVRTTNFDTVIESDTIYAQVHQRLESGLYIVSLSETKGAPNPNGGQSQQMKQLTNTSPSSKGSSTPGRYAPIQFNMGASHDICISHIENNGSFWCQLVENAPKLDSLMTSLQHAPTKPLHGTTKEETPCLVSKDSLLYRGKIVRRKQSGADVSFVDFGNIDFIPEEDIFQIQPELMSLPAQAIYCKLDGAESSSTDTVINVLSRFTSTRALVGKVVLKTPHYYDMDLYDESGVQVLSMVNKVLQNNGNTNAPSTTKCTVPNAEVNIGSQEKIFVTFPLSNNEFFGQLAKYPMEMLDALQEKLIQHYSKNQTSLKSAQAGDFCVTMFSEDENYYRARILEVERGRCHVSFVDYGNEEMKPVSELFVLDSEFCQLPAQGIQCSLADNYAGMPDSFIENLIDHTLVATINRKLKNGYSVSVPDVAENREIFTQFDKFTKKKKVPTATLR